MIMDGEAAEKGEISACYGGVSIKPWFRLAGCCPES